MKHAMSTAIRSALAALMLTMALPSVASAQQRAVSRDNSSSTTGSQAVPRAQAPAPAPAAPRAAAPSSEPSATRGRAPSADSSAPRSAAVPRSAGRPVAPESGSPATSASPASSFASQSSGARPREGRPAVGTAVPRGSVSGPRPPIYVQPVYHYPYYGGYWPWGFGGIGFGSYYGAYFGGFWGPYYPWYGGYPWFGSGYYGGYYGYPASYTYGFEGSVRLKVKPRNAQVFVDGYYVGVVDEFDGVMQRLHLESGPHRLEVRADGYETMTFDVRVRFDDTTTLEGQLKPIR
jgi:PEGA domain-containing protein